MISTIKAIWIAAKGAYRADATLAEAVELAALCVLAVARRDRPSGKLALYQARALIRRAYARQMVEA